MDSNDWQLSCKRVKERGKQLLQLGQWTDCTFLLGTDSNQVVVKGHKLFLAMASPVFEAMFYGEIAERNDPISILDIQPDAFKALLEYIYTDNINITSFDKACELCYAAKKYMLPYLVQECTNYLWSDLHAKNACRAYEFAILFEESILMKKCLQIICTETSEILNENNFEDISLTTLIKIFEQDELNIKSELDLFYAAERYAKAHSNIPCRPQSPQLSDQPCHSKSIPSNSFESIESTNNVHNNEEKMDSNNPDSASTSSTLFEIPKISMVNNKASSSTLTIRDAIKKIRFLTLTPQQFAEGPAKSDLLYESESFAIIMNILSTNPTQPLPEGFSTSKQHRNKGSIMSNWISMNSGDVHMMSLQDRRFRRIQERRASPEPLCYPLDLKMMMPDNREITKYYCQRSYVHLTDCLNTNVLDCSVTFTVDKNICVLGVQIPTQVLSIHDENMPSSPSCNTYSEILYAHLLDADGSRLTYTHYTSRVRFSGLLDVIFNRPFYIQRNKLYKVGVVFNKFGWYPLGSASQTAGCENVSFSFGVGENIDTVRDGLIRSIIFTY